MALKNELRNQFLTERRELPAEEVKQRSAGIARQVSDDIFLNRMSSPWISVFLPITRQNEVDTWPLIRWIWAERPDIQLAAPVTDQTNQTLTHYPLTPQTTLIKNRWGIAEPLPTTNYQLPTDFDLVFVPLLAFDLQGQRVGYGGGYYDRFLAQCRPDCLKIGLSLFEVAPQIEDVEATDVRLDACITPNKRYWF